MKCGEQGTRGFLGGDSRAHRGSGMGQLWHQCRLEGGKGSVVVDGLVQ
jgi:hypothetical protein